MITRSHEGSNCGIVFEVNNIRDQVCILEHILNLLLSSSMHNLVPTAPPDETMSYGWRGGRRIKPVVTPSFSGER